ncbi:hypothetical protein ZOSMA_11347G00010, partial [Zostera marina]
MEKAKKCAYGKLVKGNKLYQTQNTVEFDPPNRFTSFTGPRETLKRNCILLEITIFSHFNSTQAVSAAADLTHCQYDSGSCRPAINEFVRWEPNKEKNCKFIEFYKGPALTSENNLIVENLLLMLTFNRDNVETSCNNTYIISDQGLAWKTHGLKPKSGINSTTQYPSLPTGQALKVPTTTTAPKRSVLKGRVQGTTSGRRALTTRKNQQLFTTTLPFSPPTTTPAHTTTTRVTSAPLTTPRTNPFTTTTQSTTVQTTTITQNATSKAPGMYKNLVRNYYLNSTLREKYNINAERLRNSGFTELEIQELERHVERHQTPNLFFELPWARVPRNQQENTELQYLEAIIESKS